MTSVLVSPRRRRGVRGAGGSVSRRPEGSPGLAPAWRSRRPAWLGRIAGLLAARRPVLRNRLLANIPAHLLHGQASVELSARLAARAFAGGPCRLKPYDAIFAAHDAAVSAPALATETTAVYAYEDGALVRSGEPRDAGSIAIWDLPLPHYQTIADMFRDEARRWPTLSWGRRRSNRMEATPQGRRARAGHQGVRGVRVHEAVARSARIRAPVVVTPYGFPVESFRRAERPPDGNVHGPFSRNHDLRKGTPYLLEAWRRAAIPDAELHLSVRSGWRRASSTVRGPRPSLAAHSQAGARALATPRPTCWRSRRWATDSAWSYKRRCAAERPSSPRPAAEAPSASPTASTAGSSHRATSTRWSSACGLRRQPRRTAAVGRAARARAERWTWREAGDGAGAGPGEADMRVLYLNPFSQEVSGPDESLRRCWRALVPAGVEAHVVLPAPGPQVERYRRSAPRVHFAPLAVLRRRFHGERCALSGAAARGRRPRSRAWRGGSAPI